MTTHLPPTMNNHTSSFMTIPEFGAYAHLGRTFIYQLIARGDVTTIKIGRRRFIPTEAASAWRDRIITAQQLPKPQNGSAS